MHSLFTILVSLPLIVSGIRSSVFIFFPFHATLIDIKKEPVAQFFPAKDGSVLSEWITQVCPTGMNLLPNVGSFEATRHFQPHMLLFAYQPFISHTPGGRLTVANRYLPMSFTSPQMKVDTNIRDSEQASLSASSEDSSTDTERTC